MFEASLARAIDPKVLDAVLHTNKNYMTKQAGDVWKIRLKYIELFDGVAKGSRGMSAWLPRAQPFSQCAYGGGGTRDCSFGATAIAKEFGLDMYRWKTLVHVAAMFLDCHDLEVTLLVRLAATKVATHV